MFPSIDAPEQLEAVLKTSLNIRRSRKTIERRPTAEGKCGALYT
jgi:hypothetical protein